MRKAEIADQEIRKRISMNVSRHEAIFDFHVDECSALVLLGYGTDVKYEKY
jgi:hypothetical protein